MKVYFCSLMLLAVSLAPASSLAQAAPPPSPPTPTAPATQLAPTAEPAPPTQPAPPTAVAPATQPAQDSWTQAIDRGRAGEATAYQDVREKHEQAAERTEFEAGPRKLRSNLRVFAALSGGVQSYGSLGFAYDKPFGPGQTSRITEVDFGAFGPAFQLAAGLRGSVAEHFDLQTRLSFSVAATHGSMYVSDATTMPSSGFSSTNYGGADLDSSATFVGADLEGTARWLPQLFGPRFFVGLGPLLEVVSVSTSAGPHDNLPRFHVNEAIVSAYGLLELGVIFGSQEEWEVALRGAAGANLREHSKDAEALSLGVARAF